MNTIDNTNTTNTTNTNTNTNNYQNKNKYFIDMLTIANNLLSDTKPNYFDKIRIFLCKCTTDKIGSLNIKNVDDVYDYLKNTKSFIPTVTEYVTYNYSNKKLTVNKLTKDKIWYSETIVGHYLDTNNNNGDNDNNSLLYMIINKESIEPSTFPIIDKYYSIEHYEEHVFTLASEIKLIIKKNLRKDNANTSKVSNILYFEITNIDNIENIMSRLSTKSNFYNILLHKVLHTDIN